MRTVTFGDVEWNVEDIVIPAIPEWKFWDHWELGEFEPETLATIDRFVTPGSTFIDAGAWVGNVSLWAARLGAHVLAIEPDPAALEILRINCANNTSSVQIIAGALSDHTGTTFIQPHADGWGSSMTRLSSEGTEVSCWTLIDLFDVLDLDNVSLVKLDIEGTESLVLEESAPFLARLGIPLLVAMHESWWAKIVDPEWFAGYSSVEGNIGGWNHVLALP